MAISDRIQMLRKARGISQEGLADQIGVSRQAVSKWESDQSAPDLDKIILLSDFFEVTTDYLLKGVEQENNPKRTMNAHMFTAAATALNFIGLLLACLIWYEHQNMTAHGAGLIGIALGLLVYAVGMQVSSRETKLQAKKKFWLINIWLVSFIPLSLIYNISFNHIPAPYPTSPKTYLYDMPFWLVYLAGCASVMLVQLKAKRDK